MLEYVRDLVDGGVGIRVLRWKTDRGGQTWVVDRKGSGDRNGNGRRPFVVGGEAVGEDDQRRTFDFLKDRGSLEFGGNTMNVDKAAKALFTAEKWFWTAEREDDGTRLLKSTPLKF